MKSFCKNCESLQPSSFRLEHDAETRKPYEDLCCNTCHFVVATVQGREALAQPPLPEQEPVPQGSKEHLKIMMEHSAWDNRLELSDALANIDEFYATAPPQRTWIWLSDADIKETIDSICQYSGDYEEFLCKKIERKIKELNT